MNFIEEKLSIEQLIKQKFHQLEGIFRNLVKVYSYLSNEQDYETIETNYICRICDCQISHKIIKIHLPYCYKNDRFQFLMREISIISSEFSLIAKK